MHFNKKQIIIDSAHSILPSYIDHDLVLIMFILSYHEIQFLYNMLMICTFILTSLKVYGTSMTIALFEWNSMLMRYVICTTWNIQKYTIVGGIKCINWDQI